MKISTRLALICGVLLSLLALLSAGAVVQMRSMNNTAVEITDKWMQSVELANQLRTMASDFRGLELQHVMSADAETEAILERQMVYLQQQFDASYRNYVALATSEKERGLLFELASDWANYLAAHKKLMVLSRARDDALTRLVLDGDSLKLFKKASNDLRFLSDLNHDDAVDASLRVHQTFTRAKNIAPWVLGAALLLAGLMGWATMRSIVVPLRQAVAFADRIAEGDLTGISPATASDETGQLLKAMQKMQLRLVSVLDELRQMAFNDALTKLPNRRLLLDRLKHALAGSKRMGSHGAVLFLDLNKFKLLNDTHGHETGDQLLVEVARRLRCAVREHDTVARLGGDEFVVLLENLGQSADQAQAYAATITEKISRALSEEYVLGTIRHQGSASVGVTLFLGDAQDPDQILTLADAAMYQVKKNRTAPGSVL